MSARERAGTTANERFGRSNPVATRTGSRRPRRATTSAATCGVAVAVDDGLLVPVIRDVDALSIAGLNRAIVDVANRARANKLRIDDFGGGTFTIDKQVFDWAAFVNAVITFVLTAAVVYFVVVLPMKTIVERRKRGEEAGPVAPTQVELLVEIRDLLRAQQGQGRGNDPTGPGTTVLPGQL